MSLPDFFFDRVSAEIRQQMDGVLALAEQLARQPLARETHDCVAGISEAAAGVRRTMERAVDLRAAAVQDIRFAAEAVSLRALVDEVQARWQPRAAQVGVTLLASYDGDPEARVVGDRPRLIQVFDGLVGEAVASASRGAVELSLRARAGAEGVWLSGRVRGGDPGRDERSIEARVRDIDARLGLEVALGMMLSRRVISALGGRVSREASAGAAETVQFEVTLPAAQAVAADIDHPASDSRAAHVLVVDDNATNRVVAQALCEMLQCTSEAAADGVEALAAARTGRFDLILMDIRMPNMDGIEATHEIRKIPGRVGATPIVALTANVDPDDAKTYLAAGMNGVLGKPMKAEDLRAALIEALGEGGEAEAA